MKLGRFNLGQGRNRGLGRSLCSRKSETSAGNQGRSPPPRYNAERQERPQDSPLPRSESQRLGEGFGGV